MVRVLLAVTQAGTPLARGTTMTGSGASCKGAYHHRASHVGSRARDVRPSSLGGILAARRQARAGYLSASGAGEHGRRMFSLAAHGARQGPILRGTCCEFSGAQTLLSLALVEG